MHRRALLFATLAALSLPSIARAEPSESPCGTALPTFQLPRSAEAGHDTLSVTVRRQGGLVAPLPTVDEILAPVIATGHQRAGIEFYLVARDTLPPPPELDLEAIFVTWTSLEGAAAVKRSGSIGVIQDGGTQWTIAVSGEERPLGDLLGEVAMFVSRLASEAAPGSDATLLELLPTETDLPDGWQLATERVTPEPCER